MSTDVRCVLHGNTRVMRRDGIYGTDMVWADLLDQS